MTGAELTAVWLFAIICAAVTVTSVAKSWSTARIDVAKENARFYLEANRLVAEAQHGPMGVPDAWLKGGES